MDRRAFLRGIGTLTVVSAGGGGWFAYLAKPFDDGSEPAYQPWKDWQDWQDHAAEGPLALVRAAILAASPHNTQPWRFHVTESAIDLILDRRRNVGALDPYLREENIGMGCALENLLLAAEANGYSASMTLPPAALSPINPNADSSARFEIVARIHLAAGPRQSSELHQAIPHRHTNRTPYDPQTPLPASFLQELKQLPRRDEEARIYLFTELADRRPIVDIGALANHTLYSDPKIEAASRQWLRLSREDAHRLKDGLAVDNFGLSPAMTAFAKTIPTPMLSRIVEKAQLQGYAERMLAAPLIGVIAVRNRYDRAQCLLAGRLWQRAHLLATARGIAARPCSEAIELIDYERFQSRSPITLEQFGRITGEPDWQPIFLFLMGYSAQAAPASPRLPVEKLLDS
jgi:nitroreductase